MRRSQRREIQSLSCPLKRRDGLIECGVLAVILVPLQQRSSQIGLGGGDIAVVTSLFLRVARDQRSSLPRGQRRTPRAAYLQSPARKDDELQRAQAKEICERILLFGRISSEFALALDEDGGGPEAEGLHASAEAVFRRLLGPEHPDTLVARARYAASISGADQLNEIVADPNSERIGILASREPPTIRACLKRW